MGFFNRHKHTYGEWVCVMKVARYDMYGDLSGYRFKYVASCTECGKFKKRKA